MVLCIDAMVNPYVMSFGFACDQRSNLFPSEQAEAQNGMEHGLSFSFHGSNSGSHIIAEPSSRLLALLCGQNCGKNLKFNKGGHS